MSMSVSAHRSDDAFRLRVAGEIDLGNVDALQAEVAAALEADDTRAVIVDLADVSFLDSSGISALLKGRRLADGKGKGFRVEAARGMVREVLTITGVWQHLSGE
ncbi:STAS domain-containing protein [Rugosimonospora africana]|uniref:Anti-sigma factor antagonist n=1 Tax=Rugosimonospora africana TaxID=556532 RepID=A0A8J3R1J2_9ACTN|nr:STAS domain-containing protein [Rugosimonospora africana]GIH19913.1 anti-sigma factor antagonist [Rugosimonospora africana]